MCGITGILSFDSKEIKSEVIHSMNNQQIHRGPDGEGIWINDTSNVGLGHRRLSILDLSERGAQPMHLANNRFSITFNGEIYNYVELKKELLDSGVSFSTETDTEVLLVLYTKYGADCLQKLDGMFAFSIWDDVKKELFCARDRFGEKPFYFYKDSNRFVFASEMKALFAAGVTKSINTERVGGYLKYNAIVDHHDLSSTFYKDIYQLEASNFLLINNSGNVTKTKYWELNNTLNSTPTIKEASVRFRELFEQSVKRRLRADVSVGSSLSGGLDSSSIVRVIDELKNKTQKQKTFSARFKDFDKDEGEYIEAVINRSNVDAHYTWPDGDKFINDLEKVAYHQEEPFQSASISAQWEVMKFAKEHNTNVLMDGQGADEYLAGYHSLILPYLKDLYLKDKAQFCKCNNCGEVFFDTNPTDQPFFEIPKNKSFRDLTTQEDKEGFFQGCPECKTDGALIDLENEQLL